MLSWKPGNPGLKSNEDTSTRHEAERKNAPVGEYPTTHKEQRVDSVHLHSDVILLKGFQLARQHGSHLLRTHRKREDQSDKSPGFARIG